MSFFRFPAMAKLSEWDMADQLTKIEEELEEVRNAYFGNECNIATGVELMDLIHASETALRMLFTDEEVESLHSLAISKNAKRGYYEEVR